MFPIWQFCLNWNIFPKNVRSFKVIQDAWLPFAFPLDLLPWVLYICKLSRFAVLNTWGRCTFLWLWWDNDLDEWWWWWWWWWWRRRCVNKFRILQIFLLQNILLHSQSNFVPGAAVEDVVVVSWNLNFFDRHPSVVQYLFSHPRDWASQQKLEGKCRMLTRLF